MLAQTVRNNLKNINNLNMRGKTAKFSSLFSTAPTIETNKSEVKQILMRNGLVTIEEEDLYKEEEDFASIIDNFDYADDFEDEFEIIEELQPTEEEIAEYIVENPNEVVVHFPIESAFKLNEKLPFFKSISLKLANL